MRMRLKKNLPQRVEACRPYLLDADDSVIDARAAVLDKKYLSLPEFEGKRLELEVGCGKGGFALSYCKKYPNRALIAVEKLTNVIIEGAEQAREAKLDNLRFLRSGTEYLPRFIHDNTISRIYMNFPCPFNKESYHDRRMTAESFLQIYDQLLTADGEICLKTDNVRMFIYSLEHFSAHGYVLCDITFDLHASEWAAENIVTEYESKFIAEGKPIYRVVCKRR